MTGIYIILALTLKVTVRVMLAIWLAEAATTLQGLSRTKRAIIYLAATSSLSLAAAHIAKQWVQIDLELFAAAGTITLTGASIAGSHLLKSYKTVAAGIRHLTHQAGRKPE